MQCEARIKYYSSFDYCLSLPRDLKPRFAVFFLGISISFLLTLKTIKLHYFFLSPSFCCFLSKAF